MKYENLKRRNGVAIEYVASGIIALLFLAVSVPLVVTWFALRHLRWTMLVIALLAAMVAVAWSQTPSGFVLRGQLDLAATDGTPYFKIGDALILTMPRDSALVPNIRPLEGKKVVITLFEDK